MKEIKWVSIAKTAAIAGVLVQHVNGLLYSDQRIFQSVTYAVAVFIMLGGYLTALSYERNGIVLVRKKITRLLIPYIAATAIYVFYMEKSIDLENVLYYVFHFNVSGPFYYVWVYCQLIVLSPMLIGFLKWANCGGVTAASRNQYC